MSYGKWISGIAALLIAVGFFSPWMSVAGAEQSFGSFSGSTFASSDILLGVGEVTIQAQKTAFDTILFLAPTAAIVALLLLALLDLSFVRRQLVAIGQIGAASAGLVAMLVVAPSVNALPNTDLIGQVTFTYELGRNLSFIGLGLLLVGSGLIWLSPRIKGATTAPATAAKRRQATRLVALQRLFEESVIATPLATLIITLLLFCFFVDDFATLRTFSGIINAIAISGFVTIGVTLLMIAGEFDLSVGAILAMAGFLYGTISTGEDTFIVNTLLRLGLPIAGGSTFFAVVFALGIPAIMGLLNGLLLVKTRIPSFIVTLGTRQIYRGIVWLTSGGLMFQTLAELRIFAIFNGRFDSLNDLFTNLYQWLAAGAGDDAYAYLTGSNFRTAMLWLVGIAILLQLILNRTQFGNYLFAVGGNEQAAIAQGVRSAQVKVMAFVVSGIMAGMGGIVAFSQFKTVRVAEQAGIELTAIAAAVVGGTLLSGGFGSIWGGLIGIVLISVLRSGVTLMDISFIPADNFPAVVGLTIIGAAILNNYFHSKLKS